MLTLFLLQIDPRFAKLDLKTYTQHRINVVYAQPRIDNKPPKFSLEVYYNENKLKNIAHQVKILDDNNMEMLKDLNIVHRSPVSILKNLILIKQKMVKLIFNISVG